MNVLDKKNIQYGARYIRRRTERKKSSEQDAELEGKSNMHFLKKSTRYWKEA